MIPRSYRIDPFDRHGGIQRSPAAYLALLLSILVAILVGCSPPQAPRPAAAEQAAEPLATPTLEFRLPTPTGPAETPAATSTPQPGSSSQGQAQDPSLYQDIPVGFTAEGFPYRGDPDAPVILEEYSDYLCPYCGRHFNQTLPALIEQYVAAGQVQYVFRDMPLVSLHPNAPVGHKAARCVGEQSASGYWQMHDELFSTQGQWGSAPDPVAFVTELAKNTGVDMDAFETCMASSEVEAQINASVAAGSDLGFSGTPSFQFVANQSGESYTLVGAYPLATFTEWIDALLAGEAPPQSEQAGEKETPELPVWANQDGLVPDPERPGYTLAGDEYKGNPEAKVVVVEFSDFQCPACRSHALEVQPVLDREFVETGKILWVFKHLPLRIHPQALVAATAAECAAEQGHFWEMHDLLFAKQDQWTVENPEPALIALAEEAGNQPGQFSTCLASREALERVVADIYDSQGIISSTPNFVVLYNGRGTLLQSSRPADQFVTLLEGILDQVNGGEEGE